MPREPGHHHQRRRSVTAIAVIFNRPLWLVTDYEEGSRALLDRAVTVDMTSVLTPEQLAQMPETPEEFQPLRRNILTVDPPEHTRLRKLVQPSFTASAIEKLRPRIQQIVDDLLDAAEAVAAERGESAPDRQMELISQFSYPLPITVICDMLGIPPEDREQTRRWSEDLLSAQSPERMEEIGRNIGEFIAYLRDLFDPEAGDPWRRPHLATSSGRGRRRSPDRGRGPGDGLHPVRRRPHHDGESHRQRRLCAADPSRPSGTATRRSKTRQRTRSRRSCATTVRPRPPPRALPGRRSSWAGRRLPRATRYWSSWPRPTAIPPASSTRKRSRSRARTRTGTSPSARAFTPASAPRWPGSRDRSRSRPSSAVTQIYAWPCQRARSPGRRVF